MNVGVICGYFGRSLISKWIAPQRMNGPVVGWLWIGNVGKPAVATSDGRHVTHPWDTLDDQRTKSSIIRIIKFNLNIYEYTSFFQG